MDKANILLIIKTLYPTINDMYADEELNSYIDICMPIVALEGANLTIPEQEYACALLVLDICLAQTENGLFESKKEIKNANISYGKFGTSRWRNLYDMLINGSSQTDNAIFYVGL